MRTQHYDIVIIGGGINGAAIAREAAGRGFSVCLVEREDFGGATSSASSKLIHGGLRYLETYEFSLVRESLHERRTLMQIAPHLVLPIKFLIPITKDQKRPVWFVRLGLYLYDRLAGEARLGWSGKLETEDIEKLPRLHKDNLKTVLHYQDCQTDDNRLVLSTLFDARHLGADIHNYTAVTKIIARRDSDENDGAGFDLTLCSNDDSDTGSERTITARHVINVAGPWVNKVNEVVSGVEVKRHDLRLVRGSHLIVKMPQPSDKAAYTLQNADGRILFTIPWLGGKYLLIGTTDQVQANPDQNIACSIKERDYLLTSYNRYFPDFSLSPDDIIEDFAGLRPLADNGADNPSKVTRDFTLAQTQHKNGKYICVYGGKLTTHRVLAQKVLSLVLSQQNPPEITPKRQDWTSAQIMADSPASPDEIEQLVAQGFLMDIAESVRRRWVMSYGKKCATIYDLYNEKGGNVEIAKDIYAAELRYVFQQEECKTAHDFLGHRSWLKLSLSEKDIKRIEFWFHAASIDFSARS